MNPSIHTSGFRLSVAPMLDWSDRHYRYFMRGITRTAWLYTEMVPTSSLIHGDKERFLAFDPCEHPLVLQLGGNDPQDLAECARMGEDYGYDEINLNVGCPSDKVQGGNFGACLMARPELVADCIDAMRSAVSIPVTIKCRIGIVQSERELSKACQKKAAAPLHAAHPSKENLLDPYASLHDFIYKNSEAGGKRFIIHARMAVLGGLSPKANRSIPPLRYDWVHRLKADFPGLAIELNGGLRDLSMACRKAEGLDGAMIGRAAYENPWIFAEEEAKDRRNAALRMIPYLEKFYEKSGRFAPVTRHMLGLFHGQRGARRWRRLLSDHAFLTGIGSARELIETALPEAELCEMPSGRMKF